MEHTLPTYPTWERCVVLSHTISSLSIRDRRNIFQMLRSPQCDLTPNLLFPRHGFTLGEFSVWYTLNSNRTKQRPKE